MAASKRGTKGIKAPSIDVAFGYLILRSARLLRMNFLKLLSEHGHDITPEQWFLLNRLWEHEGPTQAELSDRAFNDRPNVTRMLDALERAKLVRREQDADDRRVSRVFLTEKGRALREELWPIALKGREQVYRGLSDHDYEELRRILSIIDANILGG